MKLNRQTIQRMIDTGGVNIGGRKTAGGGGGAGGGGVSSAWVDENYVSKEFFARLFTIHGHDAEDESDPPEDIAVIPNDLDTPIDSIEAMFGIWTEQFVSALGQGSGGGGGGGASALYDLFDVVPNDSENPTMVYGLTGDPAEDDGKVLTFSQTFGKWIASPATGGSVTAITLEMPIGLLVNGVSSYTITGEGTFSIALDDGFHLLTESQFDILDNLRYSTWWGQPVQNGVVYGAMTNVPSIDNLLFFDTSNFQTYFAVGGNYNSKFTFLENMMHQSILSMMNDGEVDATQALVLKSGELVINNSPTSNSGKNLALFANDTMFFDTGTTERMRIDSAGNVGIGSTDPYTLLHVAGGVKADKFYLYKPNKANDTGAIYFSVEYENNVAIGVHLYGGGVSADTYVTALGVGSSSGGGGATSLTQLSDVNPNMNPQAGNVLTYLNGKWTAAAAGGSGTVTQIIAGNGLSGGTITMSGTIAINDDTITKINNGASAYNSLSSYLQKTNAKTLSVLVNSSNVLTYNPATDSANSSFNLKNGTGISVSKSGTDITFSLTNTGVSAGTYRSVTVNAQGRVTNGTNPTTLAGYGITINDIMWSQITAGNASRLTTTNKTAWGQTYWTSGGVPTSISGNMTSVGNISMSGDITMTTGTSAERRIQFDNSNYFNIRKISDRLIIKSNGAEVINIYNNQFYSAVKIKTAVGLESNGYVTALATASSSDERMKNIIEHFALSVEDIAEAPIVRFTWKNNDDKRIHAGSIAQYWQKVLPESVLEVDGKLSLQYGVLALLSAISLARTVVNHEQRIARLEKELSN